MSLFLYSYIVGDRVNIGKDKFRVHSIQLLTTTFRDLQNKISIVPNNKLSALPIQNLTRSANVVVKMKISSGVRHAVLQALAAAASAHRGPRARRCPCSGSRPCQHAPGRPGAAAQHRQRQRAAVTPRHVHAGQGVEAQQDGAAARHTRADDSAGHTMEAA